MLSFDWPWLFALLPLPWLVYRLLPSAPEQQAALRVPFFAECNDDTSQHARTQTRRPQLFLLSLVWAALVGAAASPSWIGEPIQMPASGRDLLLAVDISGSMETPDMNWNGEAVNRLTTVKLVVGDFVQRRESDRLGLVLFGTNAYLQAPLTFDRNTVNRLLQEAQLGFAGEKTAIGDAIGLATKRLRQRPEGSRVLILLTDGANTAGKVAPLKAAQLATQSGIKIYTIGIGADQMTKPGLFGTNFGARTINPSRDLDETTLQTIANESGGQYFRARSPEDLELIYQQLDSLEPIEQEAETFRPTKSLFYWPLGSALTLTMILLLTTLLPNQLRRKAQTQT